MRSKRIAAIVAGILVSSALIGVAAAEEHEPTDVYGGGDGDVVVIEYDEEDGTLTIGIRGEDGEFPDCTPDETEGEPEAALEEEGEEPADGDDNCFVVDVEGDPADLNHGDFVSAVAKALHPSLLPDGVKKGHIMRVVAKSKLGKDGADDETEVDVADADDELDAEAKAAKEAAKAERKAARDEAKAERKAARDAAKAARDAAKAERKAGKAGGPPSHAKAHGKRGGG